MNNCFIFALKLWIRRKGVGYLLIRKSRMGNFPHFLYGEIRNDKLRLINFVPLNPREKKLPPPTFNGKVKWGDRC